MEIFSWSIGAGLEKNGNKNEKQSKWAFIREHSTFVWIQHSYLKSENGATSAKKNIIS